jgi:hypothetical protein
MAATRSSDSGCRPWSRASAPCDGRVIKQQSGQQVVTCVADAGLGGPLIRKLLLNRIEEGTVHDRRLLARQDVALISDLADIKPVAQEIGQRSPLERDVTAGAAGLVVQNFLGLVIEVAKSVGLDSQGQDRKQQLPLQVRRRGPVKNAVPSFQNISPKAASEE